MKGRFSSLEARVEGLVEGTFARLFAGRVHPRDVAVQLARALEDSAASGAPATYYAVRLNPEDVQALLGDHPRLGEALADELLNMARDAQLTLPHRPDVMLLPDPTLKPRSVRVTAEARVGAVTATLAMTPVTPSLPATPPGAFLILDGERTVPLLQPVVSLGRRLDNHVILEDSRVSRAHAQLRVRFGRYVIYDLGSSGGTYVNGHRVDECVLRAGDVISLGGVPLIYGEDEDEARRPPWPFGLSETGGPGAPADSDRQTRETRPMMSEPRPSGSEPATRPFDAPSPPPES